MALKYPDRLESNNPKAFGIAKAVEISGHKTVKNLDGLYSIADCILSDSKSNLDNDAIGQEWYVIDQSAYYRLVSWENRNNENGWIKRDGSITGDIGDIQDSLNTHISRTDNPHKVTKDQVGLGNVDNTSDKLKPISDATKTALDGKVDKVTGKSLVNDDQINKLSSLKTQDGLNADIADAKETGIDAKTEIADHKGRTDNPHNVDKTQIGLSNVTNDAQVRREEMGAAFGVATLDDTGKVSSSQLPSYVDEVLEFQEKDSFPKTGESGKIYVELTSNLTYRWSGTQYVEISPSIGLGETSSTAYAGDKGAAVTNKVNNLARKNISYIDSKNAFVSDKSNVALNYIYFSGDDNWELDIEQSSKIPVASIESAGILTSYDYSSFKELTTNIKYLGHYDTEADAINYLKTLPICADTKLIHAHLTYGNKNNPNTITVIQNVTDSWNRQILFRRDKIQQRAIFFTNSERTEIRGVEDLQPLFGDRLKWDSNSHKYLLSQFGDIFHADYTDPIPMVSSTSDGLMSKEDKVSFDDIKLYDYIGILSPWNNIAKLTTESTEADILTALTITPLRGNKINTKTELFKVLDQCAINKKFLKESSTNAHVFVNHIGSCYVIYILGNKPSVLNGKLVGTSVLRSITITANSNETLAVLKNPLEINLEDINSLKQRVTDLENKVQQLIEQLTIE